MIAHSQNIHKHYLKEIMEMYFLYLSKLLLQILHCKQAKGFFSTDMCLRTFRQTGERKMNLTDSDVISCEGFSVLNILVVQTYFMSFGNYWPY